MPNSILRLATFLYGESTAQSLLPHIQDLYKKYSRQISAPDARDLDQRDALLITYGDQVRAENEHPLETLEKFLDAHVSELISGVHVLPFYPYSSDDGFSVIDYYSVDDHLGTWNDIENLARHFDLMFDAVINHISSQSVWFQEFLRDNPTYRDYFINVEGNPDLSRVVRPRALPLLTQVQTTAGDKKVWTTFSADQIDLNYANPAVLLQILDVLLFYAAHGARFIRLDAIAYLWKEIGTTSIHLPQTHAVIQLMRAVLNKVNRAIMLITETNVSHTDNISYFGDGTNEAQLVYNFALPPLVMHTLATGNATALTHWAQTLFLPSQRVTFFNFLASHDGIGVNPARGILSDAEINALVTRTIAHNGLVSYKHNADGAPSPYELNISYFDALSNPNGDEPVAIQINRFLCAQAIMLALRGMPGIYFHSLFGSRNDRVGAETSGIPRRINRQKFEREELERALNDFSSVRAQVFARYAELLHVRRAEPAFNPYGAQQVLELDTRVFAVLRGEGNAQFLCLHNVTKETVLLGWKDGERREWKNVFSGETFELNGNGVLPIQLEPYKVAWLKLQRTSD
jgi:glycosidase